MKINKKEIELMIALIENEYASEIAEIYGESEAVIYYGYGAIRRAIQKIEELYPEVADKIKSDDYYNNLDEDTLNELINLIKRRLKLEYK